MKQSKSQQLLLVTRAPEVPPMKVEHLQRLLENHRTDSEWGVMEVTSELMPVLKPTAHDGEGGA